MIKVFTDNWFQIVFLVCLFPMYKGIVKAIEQGISELPQRIHEKNMQELIHSNEIENIDTEYKNSRELQVDNYYRSISGNKIEGLFSKWMDLIVDTAKIGKLPAKEVNNMLKELMMFGSEETIRIAAIFQQYNFSERISEPDGEPFTLLFIGASLLASLKKDFTGYTIEPEHLIMIKINDFSKEENKHRWDKARKEAKELLEK